MGRTPTLATSSTRRPRTSDCCVHASVHRRAGKQSSPRFSQTLTPQEYPTKTEAPTHDPQAVRIPDPGAVKGIYPGEVDPSGGCQARPEKRRRNRPLFTLSDVWFSRNGKLALTAISTFCGSLCGQHRWKVFEKMPDGEWQERNWITCFTIAESINSPAQDVRVPT